jgi:hypothetical protein
MGKRILGSREEQIELKYEEIAERSVWRFGDATKPHLGKNQISDHR